MMKGATFVDLDGTLAAGNSMHAFMLRAVPTLLKRRAPGAAICALWWMGLRSLRLISHKNMKWHLTKSARRHFLDEDWTAIAERIATGLNPKVKDYVDSRKERGCAVVIATAAMEEYTAPLARILGYDGAVATVFDDDRSSYEERRGRAKLDGIRDLMEREGLRLESFLTDHYDDLPTAAEYPGLTIIVNPHRKMQAFFRNAGVTRYI